ncbi:hypothetical protein A6V36_33300 [Paraburkholderia ginsengiterrae]|uniref:Phasin domain-containing protein n=1 Tax=Paraburkholderia ginsengiterrae TaxID=1462993 RepID=A0A1A9N4Q6_9BURK|nr:phasin family protein [Paraburkholderia ginsengiterrae]OAJ56770.1 hypothetical protein A6V36_33300 [Paraburkholderia ginsengiterrae]OAJ57194.1 hypothetical protein A6V37_30050 [Paraburkholderia ginsengiterrae]
MSAFTLEQFIASHRANIATLFTLTDQIFDGYSKLVELNLAAARTSRAESAKLSQEILSCTTPEELLARHTSQLQPASEQVLTYASHLRDIVRDTQSKWMKTVEAQHESKTRYASNS